MTSEERLAAIEARLERIESALDSIGGMLNTILVGVGITVALGHTFATSRDGDEEAKAKISTQDGLGALARVGIKKLDAAVPHALDLG